MNPPPPPFPPTPAVAPPPARKIIHWTTPEGRVVPGAWAITLTALVALSMLLAICGAIAATPPPPLQGKIVYASSLAHSDNAWLLLKGQGKCAFAGGGLDATSATAGLIATTCILRQDVEGNLRLSVRLLPQAQLSGTLRAAIVIHGAVAFLFDNTGTVQVMQIDPATRSFHRVAALSSIQWHTDGLQSNTVVAQFVNGVYTVALNGAQIYEDDLTVLGLRSPIGDIALGSFTPKSAGAGAASEAIFADVTVATA